jgi:hypothetical protein
MMRQRRRQLRLCAAVLAVSLPLSLHAQRATKRVYLEARDSFGALVLNLTAADLTLTENGQQREVTRLALGRAPLRIALLVDSSTATQPMMTRFKEALNGFVETLPPEHEIAFITTGGQIRVRTPPSTDRRQLKQAIGMLQPEGGANAFLDTLLETDQRFLQPARTQWPVFVVLTTDITDARREPDINRYNKFMNDFLARGGTAHAIVMAGKGFGPVTDLTTNLVENTGGLYNALIVDSSLPEKLKDIARRVADDYAQMQNRYEVEFAGDPKLPQAMVNVAVAREGVVLQMSVRRPF